MVAMAAEVERAESVQEPTGGRVRAFGRRARAFWRDQAGLTVSAIVLIGILVVATVGFGVIAADKIAEAGDEVESVDFGG